jgi:hypothetical protein
MHMKLLLEESKHYKSSIISLIAATGHCIQRFIHLHSVFGNRKNYHESRKSLLLCCVLKWNASTIVIYKYYFVVII